jgi:hypothetical protein
MRKLLIVKSMIPSRKAKTLMFEATQYSRSDYGQVPLTITLEPWEKPMAVELRRAFRGRDVLYHGTRYPKRILLANSLLATKGGGDAVCLTRSPEVATYWAAIPRDDDEKFGAVFVLDRLRLKSRYRLDANHDFECILDQDEMEERVWGRDICALHTYVVGLVWEPRRLKEPVGNQIRP